VEPSNGSLRERSLPSVRVQELVEPPNGSLRERSPHGACVQEIVEPLQPPNSLEFRQIQPLDELRQLAADLNRRLELGMASSTVQQCGPMGERFFQRLVDEGTPSVVRPVTIQDQHPNVRFQTAGNNHGQANGFCPSPVRGLHPGEGTANCLTVPETPEIYYPAKADKEREVLLSGLGPTPSHVHECSRQEVRRYRTGTA